MKRIHLIYIICIACLIGGCGHDDGSLVITLDNELQTSNISVSATFQDNNNIIITDTDSNTIINEIPNPFDQNKLFLSMTDEGSGFLLYCSTPAAGLMEKHLYVTENRWAAYEEKDISSLIDGYPESFCALSQEHLYVGTQMRSNGYLFESADGGDTWEPVFINENHYRDGYIDKDGEILYVLLEYVDEASGTGNHYDLYRSDSTREEWEKAGNFTNPSGRTIEFFFINDGRLYYIDSQGAQYRIEI